MKNNAYNVNNATNLSIHMRYEAQSTRTSETGQFFELRTEE